MILSSVVFVCNSLHSAARVRDRVAGGQFDVKCSHRVLQILYLGPSVTGAKGSSASTETGSSMGKVVYPWPTDFFLSIVD